ncbi:precorrin-3B C(17)-methyltransferase [Spirulina sp. CS-785/01]|uniref:precorrin-3B C(17)-methyltransferase n=1 Tax=Spirulina sp. CS-785/01 TaxID=3021716 RepID=UPI00232E84EA|nr:precorrin-3B C(17)-methyltransferase [Spirulina sp. CS-785/01]MDB9314678.1 precorrin-3B C(17)-methyltransferase [Spirulina sp. CS-785/01]
MTFDRFHPLALIATTPQGIKSLKPLCASSGAVLYVPEKFQDMEGVTPYTGSLRGHLEQIWPQYQGFIFALATGAVVRLIAPLLQDKTTDPPVVVVDELGQAVISLCSGHQGGADQLTQLVARTLQGTAIITGSCDGSGLSGIDILGVPFGWRKGTGDWTGVSSAIASQTPVQVHQEAGSPLWQQHLSATHPFSFTSTDSPQAEVWISFREQDFSTQTVPQVQWHPRVLWVGIGCERGTAKTLLDSALDDVFSRFSLAKGAIAGIATIDLKGDERAIVELCEQQHYPLRTFSPEELKTVQVPTPSSVVAQEVGTPSVAEAAALLSGLGVLGDGEDGEDGGETRTNPLIVPKQIYKQPGQGAVTIAVAVAEQEYTGRTGKLYLVGTGPGALDQITPAAQTAITDADAVIGYSLYLDLISPLFRPGQILESLPITQEKARAERAIELANWGLTVAVVSSGDCGIYGMAGLVMEELQVQRWDGKTPSVRVFPGISALQAAASRVGTPLMHDFCSISLSDLLTPWEVIEKRLQAAASGDFVTAIYNPRSRSRTQQIIKARDIFLEHRRRDTPVTLVKSAYREDEHIQLTTLDKMLDFPIDMLTTLIIGNQSTRRYEDWLITPRGYLGWGNKVQST